MFIRNNAVTFRLLLLFLLVLLPIFFMGLFFYEQGVSLQDEMMAQSMGQHLNWEIRVFSDEVRAVQETLIYLSKEAELSAFASRFDTYSEYQRAYMLNKLQSRLHSISISHDTLSQITLWLPQTNKCISAKSLTVSHATIADIDQQELSHTLAQSRLSCGQTTLAKEGMFYLYQLPLPGVLTGDKKPYMLFRADFNLQHVLNEITENFATYSLGYMLLDEESNLLETNATDQHFIDALLGLTDDPAFFHASPNDTASFHDLTANAAHTMSINGQHCYVLTVASRVPRMRIIFYVPRDYVISNFVNYRAWVWGLTGAVALTILLYSWYAYRHVQKPITLLLAGFEELESGHMDFSIAYQPKNEFHLLVDRFNHMLLRLKGLLTQLYEQRLFAQEAEMKQLQAQINPHFLYNNFYILDSMLAIGDYDNASIFLQNLGRYFKYVTQNDRTEEYLQQEVAHCRTYLAIQSTRFGELLTIDFQPLEADFPNPLVPKLILQPIVENAFKHAFEQSDALKALKISILHTPGWIEIKVENSGHAISPENLNAMRATLDLPADQRASTGLANVHKRLLISHNSGLILSARPEGGLCVSMRLRYEEVT